MSAYASRFHRQMKDNLTISSGLLRGGLNMFCDRYKIVELTGSTALLYQALETKCIFKSIKSATREPIWYDNVKNPHLVTKKDVEDVDWLKPYIKRATKSIIIKHHGNSVECVLIMKVKCK